MVHASSQPCLDVLTQEMRRSRSTNRDGSPMPMAIQNIPAGIDHAVREATCRTDCAVITLRPSAVQPYEYLISVTAVRTPTDLDHGRFLLAASEYGMPAPCAIYRLVRCLVAY